MNGSLQSISNGALFELKRAFEPRRDEAALRDLFQFCRGLGMKVRYDETQIESVKRFIGELSSRAR